MNLTAHFTLEELTFSSTAERLGITNAPEPLDALAIRTSLTVLANGLEQVRYLLGHPLHVDSGYRCWSLNRAVGGAADSAHLKGLAADIICAAFGTPLEIVKAIEASSLVFDQCIQEGSWVHISFDPRARREVLTAHFVDGQRTTYSLGA